MYDFNLKGYLRQHKMSIYKGVKCECNKCDYNATWQSNPTHHIHALHE